MSTKLNTNHTLRLRILTPVHVGAGSEKDWIRGVDFVENDDRVFILKKDEMLASLPPQSLDRYVQLLSTGDFFETEKWLLNEIDPDEFAEIVFPYEGLLNGTTIKTIIRDGNGDTYLPGSSIKGAMMSAIFHCIQKRANYSLNRGKAPVSEALGDFEHSIGRFLRPGDAVLNQTELAEVSLFNLSLKDPNHPRSFYKPNFEIPMETFLPEKETSFRLSIADGLAAVFAEFETGGQPRLPDNLNAIFRDDPLKFLFKRINETTRDHIGREKAFFNAFPQADDTDLLVECLDKMEAQIPADGSACVLRMSAGSGFHSMTGDWRIEDHTGTVFEPDPLNTRTKDRMPARYKSRKAFRRNAELPGFVRLEIIN